MAAPPMARPVAVTLHTTSADTRTTSKRDETNADDDAALTSTDDMFAMWSAEPTEPVAAAALRSFCEGGGQSGAGGDGSSDSISSSNKSSGSGRRSGGRSRPACRSREAPIAAAAAASPSPSPSLTFHRDGLLVAQPHSARSTSGASSVGEGLDAHAESSSRASSLSPRRSRSRSRSPPSSSSSRRSRGRGAEGKRGQSDDHSDGAGDSATATAPRTDYSAASSESHARTAQAETVRREEARAPPRRPPPPAAARYNTFGEWERPGIGRQSTAAAGAAASPSAVVQARLALQQADHIPRWLGLHGFDESVYPRLVQSLCPVDSGNGGGDGGAHDQPSAPLSVALLLRQTKSGLKSLLGVRDGIRLHLALRDLEAAHRIVENAGSQRCRHLRLLHLRRLLLEDLLLYDHL